MLELKSLQKARKMIAGVEAMHMIRKRQFKFRDQSVQNQNIDETYIKVKGEWRYLYHAIDPWVSNFVKQEIIKLHICL